MPFHYAPDHPALADTLVHLCGRARQEIIPNGIGEMRTDLRLWRILFEQRILGFPPYGGGHPVVSMSESRLDGLAYLIREKSWAPWGVVLDRDVVWELGGGPVWYVRGDNWDLVYERPDIRHWLTRTEPGEAEWLHEREWRVPADAVDLYPDAVTAIVVGDPNWHPGFHPDWVQDEQTGQYVEALLRPPLTRGKPRWCWNYTIGNFDLLPPWDA